MGFLYVPQKQGCFLYIMQLTKGHFLYLPQKQSRFYLSQKKDGLTSFSEKRLFRQIFEFHIDCAVTVVDGHHRIGLAPSLLAGF